MLIKDYIQEIREVINSCSLVTSFSITSDERGDYRGFIVGEISFIDGSILYWREFVNVKTIINRGMYAYQYMTASKNLIFRYDNTRHHKKLNLPNFPHHKHDGSEDNVISSNAPTLVEVLQEIESSA
ncbi:toxin-antitoxin system TumE family protein [Dapis sp. BLCC M126]|uniref:toxin-antitoxin system TumE family protein n=1 Tax=Dapis sp. BLCC M126 TaxID=3400189 RepID=UPI003CFB4235